jgi:hypothetical protein
MLRDALWGVKFYLVDFDSLKERDMESVIGVLVVMLLLSMIALW